MPAFNAPLATIPAKIDAPLVVLDTARQGTAGTQADSMIAVVVPLPALATIVRIELQEFRGIAIGECGIFSPIAGQIARLVAHVPPRRVEVGANPPLNVNCTPM